MKQDVDKQLFMARTYKRWPSKARKGERSSVHRLERLTLRDGRDG